MAPHDRPTPLTTKPPHLRAQRGASAVELLGVVAAVALVAAVVAPSLAGWGDGHVATAVATRVRSAITSPQELSFRKRGSAGHTRTYGEASVGLQRGVARTADDPAWAWWERSRTWTRDDHGIDQSLTMSACTVCVGWGGGADAGYDPRAGEALLDARAHAFLSPIQLQLRQQAEYQAAGIAATFAGQGEAAVTARAQGEVELRVSREGGHLDAHGLALAGARVRAQQRAAASFAGISIREVAGVEGWAGAGATAGIEAGIENGTVTYGTRLGAALGLGGAYDFRVEVDVTRALADQGPAGAAVRFLRPGLDLARAAGDTTRRRKP